MRAPRSSTITNATCTTGPWGGARPYRLESWQKAYLRRLEKVWETCSAAAPFIDVGAGGDAYTVIEAARRGIPSVGSASGCPAPQP